MFRKILSGFLVGFALIGVINGTIALTDRLLIAGGMIILAILIWPRKKKETPQPKIQTQAPTLDDLISRNGFKILRSDTAVKRIHEGYVAFDLETTGLDYHTDEIIEIGAVKVRNGEIIDTFESLVRPKRSIPEEASKINHITDEMVQNAPAFWEVIPKFLEFVGDDTLAAHNVKFDYSFLCTACLRINGGIECPHVYMDTLAISRWKWPDLPNHKLGTVAKHVNYKPGNAHRALADAMTVHAILQAAEK